VSPFISKQEVPMSFQPFFVAGVPKSGTTWLGQLLDVHPEISCKGEACLYAFTNSLTYISGEYNKLLAKRAGHVSELNEFPPLSDSEIHSMMRYFFELRLAAIAAPEKSALKFVGEKDPFHAEQLPLLHKLFPEAKVIHIIRDGRDVILSSWHHNKRVNDPAMKAVQFDTFLDDAAEIWAKTLRQARETAPILGDRYLEIRYEDLVADVLPNLKRVLDHLGADADEEMLRTCAEGASFEKLSKGRSRGQEDAQSFFRKGLANDWRNHLTPAQIKRCNARSAGLLQELGYSD
jgi:hypothetical protein